MVDSLNFSSVYLFLFIQLHKALLVLHQLQTGRDLVQLPLEEQDAAQLLAKFLQVPKKQSGILTKQNRRCKAEEKSDLRQLHKQGMKAMALQCSKLNFSK